MGLGAVQLGLSFGGELREQHVGRLRRSVLGGGKGSPACCTVVQALHPGFHSLETVHGGY